MTSTEYSFPHPEYADHVLRPGFLDAQRLLFPYMMDANDAHVLMLNATGILPDDEARRLLDALASVRESGAEAFTYAPEVEDLFFQIEGRLIELAGVDAGGNLQIARSRNDLDAVMCHLMMRDRLIGIEERVLELRSVLIRLIDEHIDTVMPGITHTQPAQPTTLAHYLLGVLGPLERDSQRLRAASIRNNRSPLGAAAFTTTSFPIDRELTAELLGFDGIVANGYDAVGGADHMVEATQALANMAVSLVRFVNDLLIWARFESGVVRIHQAFAQISSIMPQKRNPVVFEHVRSRIGYVLGDANTVLMLVHTAAFGDTVDVEDPIYVPLARAFDSADSVLDLLTVALESVEINKQRLAERASGGFTTATAVAEGLVQDFGLPFRTAHEIAARAVKAAIGAEREMSLPDVETAVENVLGRTLAIDAEWLGTKLDPRAFVEARMIDGGPAPVAVRRALDTARELLAVNREAAGLFAAGVAVSARTRAERSAELQDKAG